MTEETKVIIVTGGGRGIGRAIAIGAAARGYAVCFSYRGEEGAADAVVQEIEAAGGKAAAVMADNSEAEGIARLFDEAGKLGRVVALVNNAAMVGRLMPLTEMPLERLALMFRTNVIGPFLCSAEAIKRLSKRHGGQGGSIVNISSAAARIGGAHGTIDYAATKGAIETFTRGLAIEAAPDDIRVNAVAPGMIDTEIQGDTGESSRLERMIGTIPMRRTGTAEEVAAAVLWLVSDDASYVTGSTITVSGGR